MSLGTKGLKVNLFPGLSPSALKVPSDQWTVTWGLLACDLSALHPAIRPPDPLCIPFLMLLSQEGPGRSLCALLDPAVVYPRIEQGVFMSQSLRGGGT